MSACSAGTNESRGIVHDCSFLYKTKSHAYNDRPRSGKRSSRPMRKIDIFNHIWPQPFYERVQELTTTYTDMNRRVIEVPMITDLGVRFRVMDQFEDYSQILSLASPPLEVVVGPENAVELARVANDSMAELVAK